ncbi:MAG: NAD(+)/NADH kinase [Chloroflexi bacterium]|nr:NAD(+)/NADH kinase [Chloroflexota bacterium]
MNRLGLIVNPRAGTGSGLKVARDAMGALAAAAVVTGEGEMGAAALEGLSLSITALSWNQSRNKERTFTLAQQIAQLDVEALVVIGGDGTLADVAWALHDLTGTPPLLGIGAGTANVGPFITCQATDVNRLREARLVTHDIDGLIAAANGNDLGLGFNDVVLDFTVLATVNGAMTTVSAAEKMKSLNAPREVEGVWTEGTRIIKRSARGEMLIAQGDQVETMIVGLPDERFHGKAIAGGVLLTSLVNDAAGCLVCSHSLVRMKIDPETYRRSEPVVSRYASLGEGEQIEGWGFRNGAALCADGNPLIILSETDHIQVRVQRGLTKATRIES